MDASCGSINKTGTELQAEILGNEDAHPFKDSA
jgi:hypothetical protein